MGFMLGNVIIDRVQWAYGEKLDGTPCLLMSELSDFTVDISAESKDAVDAQGTLVKRFWQAKTGEVTASNAMINFSAIGAQNGTDPELATVSHTIVMPKIDTVKAGETLDISGYVDGTVHVSAINNSGGLGQSYSSTDYSINAETSILTPPTTEGVNKYLVKYNRTVDSGAKLINEADKFPGTIVLIVKALCIDPCQADTLTACYLRFPSFQISPELSISLTTDTTVDFSGTLQAEYCGTEKLLYEIFIADGDEED